MTINYNLGIPAAGNNPSTDQPNMQTNNDNIANYVAIDHVAFNTSGSGQHKQVTFNSNNVPGVPTSPPVLFTNTVNSLPQLFFYSGDAAHGSNNYSINEGSPGATDTGGSTFLLGGIVLKWGIVNVSDNTTVNFATRSGSAFSTACFGVYVTQYNSSSSNQLFISVSPTPLPTAFSVRVRTASGAGGPVVISYLALGY